ncbi:ArsR/SmtB family transcription factor [Kitasatospora sp. NPDC059571]|uniref:ArsR/SmtB family transcription factor n=1 Tax=Kitasatospora sp. NPDC059571 TaxID=3346871 RepID=UPI0036B4D15D
MTERDPSEDVLQIETDQQLHAVGSLPRHRVLRVLRDGPATITQIAERLGIAKGSSNYHVKVLAKAGIVHVVDTRRVRGVTEQYYAIAAKAIKLPEPGAGEPEHLVRHALADMEAATARDQRTVMLKHVRIGRAAFEEFEERLESLVRELAALSTPGEAPADLLLAFYRPGDTAPGAPAPAPAAPTASTGPAATGEPADRATEKGTDTP